MHNWTGLVNVTSTQGDGSITLFASPSIFPAAPSNEQFLLNLTGSGASILSDPFSWAGSVCRGDIIVRGIWGNGQDNLSGDAEFSGTLSVAVVPEPSPFTLLAIGFAGLAARRRQSR